MSSESNKDKYLRNETPSYYKGKHKGITAAEVVNDFELNHWKASAVEYILRSGKKDNEIQDLTKAKNMIDLYIELLK